MRLRCNLHKYDLYDKDRQTASRHLCVYIAFFSYVAMYSQPLLIPSAVRLIIFFYLIIKKGLESYYLYSDFFVSSFLFNFLFILINSPRNCIVLRNSQCSNTTKLSARTDNSVGV